MAKKAKTAAEITSTGKARMEIRFDQDVYEKVKEAADVSGISINQFLHHLAKWAVKNMNKGQATVDENGKVTVMNEDVPGLFWFGRKHEPYTKADVEREAEEMEPHDDQEREELPRPGDVKKRGLVAFVLDFSERRIIRED